MASAKEKLLTRFDFFLKKSKIYDIKKEVRVRSQHTTCGLFFQFQVPVNKIKLDKQYIITLRAG